MARASVIEINGHKYDASTGQLIGAVKTAVKSVKPPTGQVMDGFMRRPATPTKVITASRQKVDSLKRTAQNVHQRTQKSKSVMRQIVSQPKIDGIAKATKSAAKPARRTGMVSAKRAFRAKTILKHPRISRFSAFHKSRDNEPPVIGEVVNAGQAMVISNPALARPANALTAMPAHQLERLLDHALAKADEHKQNLKLRARHPLTRINRRPRWFSLGLIALIIFGVGGLLAWQKLPGLSLKFAASRAHIDASVPGYLPYGYSIAGPVKYDAGAVETDISAGDKTKSLTVTQQSSKMDSESLAATSIPKNAPVQTSQVKGATVYIYGKDNDATWVNKGIKYRIKNKAKLSSDELLKIAASL